MSEARRQDNLLSKNTPNCLTSPVEFQKSYPMNILVIGSGGREHALAWKIAQSPIVDEVWSAPGNPGMNAVGPCFDVKATDTAGLLKLVQQLEPDLVIVGPEQPLADGLADRIREIDLQTGCASLPHLTSGHNAPFPV